MVAPEYSTLDPEDIQPWIDMAVRRTNAAYFGARYRDATAYLAAHLLTRSKSGSRGASGPLSSISADGLSMSYATAVSTTSFYSSTPYGQEFQSLVLACRGAVYLT